MHLEEEPDPSKNSTVHWVPKEPSLASWMPLVDVDSRGSQNIEKAEKG